jgi:hypothetical protein
MQQVTDTIQQVEDLQAKFSYGINMLEAVHEAMVYGNNVPGDYSGAVFGVCDYMEGLNKELADVIDKHYNSLKSAELSEDGN